MKAQRPRLDDPLNSSICLTSSLTSASASRSAPSRRRRGADGPLEPPVALPRDAPPLQTDPVEAVVSGGLPRAMLNGKISRFAPLPPRTWRTPRRGNADARWPPTPAPRNLLPTCAHQLDLRRQTQFARLGRYATRARRTSRAFPCRRASRCLAASPVDARVLAQHHAVLEHGKTRLAAKGRVHRLTADNRIRPDAATPRPRGCPRAARFRSRSRRRCPTYTFLNDGKGSDHTAVAKFGAPGDDS
jgi:hypothetical protein